jgi:hypothetical protein
MLANRTTEKLSSVNFHRGSHQCTMVDKFMKDYFIPFLVRQSIV